MNISKYTLRNQWLCRVPGALGKAQFALGKDHSAKNGSAKAALPSVFCRALGKAFTECPTLGKVGTEKKPQKMRKNGKNRFFLIGGGPHRHFSRKFRSNVADGFRTRDLPYARTSSTTAPHCHLCLDSVLVPNILY